MICSKTGLMPCKDTAVLASDLKDNAQQTGFGREGNLDSLKIALPRNKYSDATLYTPRNAQRVHYRLTSKRKHLI